jgi:hypothetical protein
MEDDLELKTKKKSDYDGDVLAAWKDSQAIPEGAETMEMGRITPKSISPSALLYWKIKREEGAEVPFQLLMGAHVKKEGAPETVLPMGLLPFRSEVEMHAFIADVKKRALDEWLNPWWKSPVEKLEEIK